jgi:hypothetical protein
MIVDKNIEKEIDSAATAHLYYVMKHKLIFCEPHNFSTVQYMNSKNVRNQVKFNDLLYKRIFSLYKEGVFLDLGVGPGFLEFINIKNSRKIQLSTVEWETQVDCFKSIRNSFGVVVNYLCSDILSDDFKIHECETYYDYVILQRFFPVYKTPSLERTELVLKKLVPYAKYALVVESDSNWSEEQYEYILNITETRTKVFGEWNIFKINLEQFK